MAITVEEYIARHEKKGVGRVSALTPHEQAIMRLRKGGYTYNQIREFLAENGVNVKVPTVASFIKRRREAKDKASVEGSDSGDRHAK